MKYILFALLMLSTAYATCQVDELTDPSGNCVSVSDCTTLGGENDNAGGCTCASSTSKWVPMAGQCIDACATYENVVDSDTADVCKCDDSFPKWNPQGDTGNGACVADCTSVDKTVEVNGVCQCVEGAEANNSGSNCACAASTDKYFALGNICVNACTDIGNAEETTGCTCVATYTKYNPMSNSCINTECTVGSNNVVEIDSTGVCKCDDGFPVWNQFGENGAGVCVANCDDVARTYLNDEGKCVCSYNAEADNANGACKCPDSGNTVFNPYAASGNGACIPNCNGVARAYLDTDTCACSTGAEEDLDNAGCKCPDSGNVVFNPYADNGNGACIANCDDVAKTYLDSDECVCSTDAEADNTNGACKCPDSGNTIFNPYADSGNGACVADCDAVERTFVNGDNECECSTDAEADLANGQCKCPDSGNVVFNPYADNGNGACIANCDSVEKAYLDTDECVCSTDAEADNANGACKCPDSGNTVFNPYADSGNGACVADCDSVERTYLDTDECACSTGAEADNANGQCKCPDSGNTVFNPFADNGNGACVADCDDIEKTQLNSGSGECECIATAEADNANGACKCPDSGNNKWAPMTMSCVSDCTSINNAEEDSQNAGVCKCLDTHPLWNPQGNNGAGECVASCDTVDKTFEDEDGVCSCIVGAEADNSNGNCICSGSNQYFPLGGFCIDNCNNITNGEADGSNAGQCKCQDSFPAWNSIDLECAADCSSLSGTVLNNGVCECPDNLPLWDTLGEECVAECGVLQEENDQGECVCVATAQDDNSGACECSNPAHFINPWTNACIADCTSVQGQDSTTNAGTCECTTTNPKYSLITEQCEASCDNASKFEENGDGFCVCVTGAVDNMDGTCVCASTGTTFWNPLISECVSDCQNTTGAVNNAGTCECDSGKSWNNSDACVLPGPDCFTAIPNCSTCSSTTECSDCNTGYEGDSCNTCATGYSGSPCELIDCSGSTNGRCTICTDATTCGTCQAGFTGDDCNTCADGYTGSAPNCVVIDCQANANQQCAICSDANTCQECNTGFDGSDCSTCKPGYSGSSCTLITCPTVDHCTTCATDTTCHTCETGYEGASCTAKKSEKTEDSIVLTFSLALLMIVALLF